MLWRSVFNCGSSHTTVIPYYYYSKQECILSGSDTTEKGRTRLVEFWMQFSKCNIYKKPKCPIGSFLLFVFRSWISNPNLFLFVSPNKSRIPSLKKTLRCSEPQLGLSVRQQTGNWVKAVTKVKWHGSRIHTPFSRTEGTGVKAVAVERGVRKETGDVTATKSRE